VRVGARHLEVKGEGAASVHAVIGLHAHLELHDVVLALVEVQVHAFAGGQLAQVFLHANLAGARLNLSLCLRLLLLQLLLLQREELDHGVWVASGVELLADRAPTPTLARTRVGA